MSKLPAGAMITLIHNSANQGRAVIGISKTLELSLKELARSMELCCCMGDTTVGQWFEDDGRYGKDVRTDAKMIDYDVHNCIESHPASAIPMSTMLYSDLPSDIADMTYDQIMEVLNNE